MTLVKGQSRPLTTGEISLARSVFCHGIDYSRVEIHHGSYFPFDLQSEQVAMAPNGSIYFMTELYRDDFFHEDPRGKHLFIHEMAHVWQYQMGMNVRMRGLVSAIVSYKYSSPHYKTLRDYSLEQQASIIADYYYIIQFGLNGFEQRKNFIGIIGPNLMQLYESTLVYFLEDAKEVRSIR